MPLIQITRASAMSKASKSDSKIFVLKPVGEKSRKALFSMDELFEGCIFLEDVDQNKANAYKKDVINTGIGDSELLDVQDAKPSDDEYIEGHIDPKDLKKAPAVRKCRGRIDIDTCKALYNADWSYEQIADEFGVKVQSVKNFIHRHNIDKFR